MHTTRREAKAAGDKYFFSGKPCKRGHIDKRFVSANKCASCARIEAMMQHTHTTDRRRSYNTPEQFIQRIHAVHGDTYDTTQVQYIDAHTKVTLVCPIHGPFAATPTNILQGKGCPQCGTLRGSGKQTKNQELFVHQAKAVWGNAFDYSHVRYAGAKNKVRLVCTEHPDLMVYQAPDNHLNSRQNPCPKCNHKSLMEMELAAFLAEHTPVEHIRKDLIPPREIDIWLPEYNMGVEFHGIHWHTTDRVGKVHRIKWELAQKAGIRLVQIFEDEWCNKKDIVKARLLAFMGKTERRDARKLRTQQIQWRAAKDLLNSTHTQGAGPAGIAYGLFDQNQLVAVATFGKSRSGAMTGAKQEGKYEVLRYASVGTVRGGFTRLLHRFIKEHNPTEIVSYCDLRFGTGVLYEKAGFSLDGITEADYWWVPKGKSERVPRYAVQKYKMADPAHPLHKYYSPEKSERQICSDAGWLQIHGVGNQRWVWTAPTLDT